MPLVSQFFPMGKKREANGNETGNEASAGRVLLCRIGNEGKAPRWKRLGVYGSFVSLKSLPQNDRVATESGNSVKTPSWYLPLHKKKPIPDEGDESSLKSIMIE